VSRDRPWGDPYSDNASMNARVHNEVRHLIEEHGPSEVAAAMLEVGAYMLMHGDAEAEKNSAYNNGVKAGREQVCNEILNTLKVKP
jgi:hypothetical protein